MSKIRTPGLIIALIVSFMIVGVEIGQSYFNNSSSGVDGNFSDLVDKVKNFDLLKPEVASDITDFLALEKLMKKPNETPPGYAIKSLSYLDSLLCFTLVLMCLPLVISPNFIGKVQGVATIIMALMTIIFSFIYLIKVLINLILMVTLLLAIPFGTLVYMIAYSQFDTGPAAAILSSVMFLKYVFAISLFLAHEKFLFNKGLVLIIATSFITMIIVSFLHSLLPTFLVSITDALAAIINCIIAIIWAIVLLVGGIIAVVKVIIGLKDEI